MRTLPRLALVVVLVAPVFSCGESLRERPALSVDALPLSTESTVIAVSGHAPASASVHVTGGAAPVDVTADAAGAFAALVPLRIAARNTLTLYAQAAGVASRSVEVEVEQRIRPSWTAVREVAPPAAPVLDPLPGAVGSTATPVAGSAALGTTVVVRDPYQIQRIDADATSGRFSAVVRLRASSTSSIVMTAVDELGNASSESVVNLVHDPSLAPPPVQAPVVPSLDALAAETTRSCVTVTGRAAPFAQIRIEGGEAAASGVAGSDGRFAMGVALRLGTANALAVRAADDAGRESDPVVVPIAQTGAPGGTRYPIVFAHGLGGFDQLFGVYPYWWGVRDALVADGYEVLMDDVAPLQTAAHRAAQLRDQVNRLTSGKVNIIGHSMGGLDARYLVSRLGFGDRVASVTSVGTPHHGSALADLALLAVTPEAFAAAELLLNLFGWSIEEVRQSGTQYMSTVFNPGTPDDARVKYFSYGGSADPLGHTGNILAPYFIPTWSALELAEGANDGLVSVRSSHWGEYRGTIPADHMDEVGQLFGIADHFDFVGFYRGIAEDLKAQGM